VADAAPARLRAHVQAAGRAAPVERGGRAARGEGAGEAERERRAGGCEEDAVCGVARLGVGRWGERLVKWCWEGCA